MRCHVIYIAPSVVSHHQQSKSTWWFIRIQPFSSLCAHFSFFFSFFGFIYFFIICIKKSTIPSKNFFFIASFINISFSRFQQIFEQLKYWHNRVLILTTYVLILSIYLLKLLMYEWMNECDKSKDSQVFWFILVCHS